MCGEGESGEEEWEMHLCRLVMLYRLLQDDMVLLVSELLLVMSDAMGRRAIYISRLVLGRHEDEIGGAEECDLKQCGKT